MAMYVYVYCAYEREQMRPCIDNVFNKYSELCRSSISANPTNTNEILYSAILFQRHILFVDFVDQPWSIKVKLVKFLTLYEQTHTSA